ncbi:MAG: hypothetical protein EOP50_13325 [Sphingobacteriales bacterium]|nr:MAG: hypothetical protein EOP50_13325 [Sphingobacteriales bacterium]
MFNSPKLRLDVASLELGHDRLNQIASIIAEETEAKRELKRAEVPDTGPQSGQNKLMGLLGGSYSYADSLRWDLLLTFGDCAFRCAERAKMEVRELVAFARTTCEPSDPWLLFWYEIAMEAISKGFDTESKTSAAAQKAVETEFRRRQSVRARTRYEKDKDGKQAVKAEVKDWWQRWRSDPSMYPRTSVFARAMLDKYPDHLTSQPVIESWVRAWRSEAEKN